MNNRFLGLFLAWLIPLVFSAFILDKSNKMIKKVRKNKGKCTVTDSQGNPIQDSDGHNKTYPEILEQFLDQWKTREDHLWSNIYRLFYGLFLLFVLPFIGYCCEGNLTADSKANLANFLNTFGTSYIWITVILSCGYLLICLLYIIRLSTAKLTYDQTLKNMFHFNRITTSDISPNFFNLPVNPIIVAVQFTVLFGEILFVVLMCFK